MSKALQRWALLAAIFVTLALLVLVLLYAQSREDSGHLQAKAANPAQAPARRPASAGEASTGEAATTTPTVNDLPEVTRKTTRNHEPPEDKTITLTVPKMERIRGAEVPTAGGADEQALKHHAGIHLKGTGYPWEAEANVYIAGHREGFPGTPSEKAFGDLDVLEVGDAIILTDAEGKTYVYRVSDSRVVAADDLSVLNTVPGKNVVTLQSCTMPDYTERLVVRAERSQEA